MSGIYRFINTNISTLGCNLRCEYCYIRQHGDEDTLTIDNKKNLFQYSVSHMLQALSVERMGGVCMFNISGNGETLLNPYIYDIVYGLLSQGHYIALISNCTVTDVIEKFLCMPEDLRNRLFFKASFHYRELKKRGLLDVYARNLNDMKKSGVSFSVEVVSNDYVLDEIDELKEFCINNFGALPHVLAGRDETVKGTFPKYDTKLSDEEFRTVWSDFDSPLFRYQDTDYILSHNGEFCYAGVYTGSLDLRTGEFRSCPGNKKITNFFENIEEPIAFAPVGYHCPFPYCFCGFFLHVLAGVSRDEYTPDVKFYEFRDRICQDGSTWLTPSIRQVFSHRCSEYHKPLAGMEKIYLTALMDVRNGSKETEKESEIGKYVEKCLIEKGIHRIAIYGMGNIGKWFLRVLEDTNIDVVCGIDRNALAIDAAISVYLPDEIPEGLDAIIVSVFYEYTTINTDIKNKVKDVLILPATAIIMREI